MKLLSVKLTKEWMPSLPDGCPSFIQSGWVKSPFDLDSDPDEPFYLCKKTTYEFFSRIFGASLENVDTIWVEVHDKPGKTRLPITAELVPESELSAINYNVEFFHGKDEYVLDAKWVDFVYADYTTTPESFRFVEDRGMDRKTYHVQFYYRKEE